MDALLGKITQHAMNYAIRSGIGITASFAISQTSRLLKTVENKADRQVLQDLQERLQMKTQIIGPAIDLITLISARGNTTLESAVTLTKALTWDIQSLGARIQKAANADDDSRRTHTKAKARTAHEDEIRQIAKDIRALLIRIEDAVPLINLAITISGASLSTQLPSSVSPSRLLQASTYLSTSDRLFSLNPNAPVQVGPTFTLSLYMLFAGHANRPNGDVDSVREMTWKEVIHKAKVKLVRFPKELPNHTLKNSTSPGTPLTASIKEDQNSMKSGEGSATHYAYCFDIIEDLNDGRVHSFEDDEPQPGPYDEVSLAGIREQLPIYQISKIFYADTGKILNIGNADEPSTPVLLLKRDISARPPTMMMEENEKYGGWEEESNDVIPAEEEEEGEEKAQDDIDNQLRRESSVHIPVATAEETTPVAANPWRFPVDLDTEWLAFEVHTEAEDSASEDGQDVNNDSAYASHRPSSSGQTQNEDGLVTGLSDLSLTLDSSPPSATSSQQVILPSPRPFAPPNSSPFGEARFTSLSTLEMLIRLASLQQFKQQSHLTIPDELLTFFLQESSSTGAGGDEKQRRQTRREAIDKVGFDPYNESPVRRRGEDYQYQNQGQENYSRGGTPYGEYGQRYSREGTPYEEYDNDGGYDILSPQWSGDQRVALQGTPEPWLFRTREHTTTSGFLRRAPPSSPVSPYRPVARQGSSRPLERVMQQRGMMNAGSPLGRGVSVETDSSLGTSPGSPTLLDRNDKTACE